MDTDPSVSREFHECGEKRHEGCVDRLAVVVLGGEDVTEEALERLYHYFIRIHVAYNTWCSTSSRLRTTSRT
jgi:hypothetical protein